MKQTKRWLVSIFGIVLLLSLLTTAALAEGESTGEVTKCEYSQEEWETVKDSIPDGYKATPLRKGDGNDGLDMPNVVDDVYVVYKVVTNLDDLMTAQNDSDVGAIYIGADIEISGEVEISKPIEIGYNETANRHYKLTFDTDAKLIHTAGFQRFGYENIGRVGTANFDEMANQELFFLMRSLEDNGAYRVFCGSMDVAQEALYAEDGWTAVTLPDNVTLTKGSEESVTCSTTMLFIYGDVKVDEGVTLNYDMLNAPEDSGYTVYREAEDLDELKAAALIEDSVPLIRVTQKLEIKAEEGVGITVPQAIEAGEDVALTIYAGEYGCDVSKYLPEGDEYICSPLRKYPETAQSTNGIEGQNLVDDLYVVYKKASTFQEVMDAEEDDTVGAIYFSGDITAGSNETITKPIEIGWDENAGEHYDLTVFDKLIITCPFQRFGFEKIGRVGNDNFDEMAEDGICFLMKGNDTRELYGSPAMAQAALEEATESGYPYMMATLLGGPFGAPTYCDCKFSEEYGFIHVGSPIQVTGMLICYGHIVMGDNSSLIAQDIWMGGGGPACTSYRHTYVLEGYRGTVTVHGGSSSEGGGGNQSSNVTTSTTTNDDGSVTTTTTNANTGEVTEVTKTPSGVSGTTVTNKDGEITSVSASVPTAAVKAAEKDDETITLPVEVPAAESSKDAVEVKIDIPASVDSLTVEIPVSNMTNGTVAVIVHADGTEEIIKSSAMGENGLLVTLEKDSTIKIVENSKEFSDVHEAGHWAEDAIDFVTSRELFTGTTETTFTPDAPTTRAQLMTVLARLDGADTSGSALEKGLNWAVENGISDGTNPSGTISRQQLAVMLWRYAGSPAAESEALSFTDAEQVSDYAQEAMLWATENGILNGYADGSLNPLGAATRAHVAQMVKNFIQSGVL